MNIPTAEKGSWDNLLHKLLGKDSLIIFRYNDDNDNNWSHNEKYQRDIGAVYDPLHENEQYDLSQLPYRFDSLLFFEKTSAVEPLDFIILH